jgi:EAL domain-containing protein (putative c-di-GMP-specific phosphodiesterase class I)
MKAIERARVRPERIIVEVSEVTRAYDPDRVAFCLNELARWKVAIAIDDFGTSSTSLSRLHQEHLKFIKIDGSLIQQVPEDPGVSRLVLGTCALAQSLKLQALAEEVETTEQLNFLRKIGCHLAQGRALVPPVAATQVKEAVKKTWKFT